MESHQDDLVRIQFAWVEVRHAPGFDDDGRAFLSTSHKPKAIPPEVGINRREGTWTTIHAVYYDPMPYDGE